MQEQTHSAEKNRHRFPLWLYSTTTLVLSAILGGILITNPFLRAPLEASYAASFSVKKPKPQTYVDVSKAMKADPSLGIPLSVPLSQHLTRQKVENHDVFLVYVSDCAGCISADFPAYERQAAQHGLQMAFLTSASEADGRRFNQTLKMDIPIVSDTSGKIRSTLNASWIGRCYVLRDGKLVWKQTKPDLKNGPFTDESFLSNFPMQSASLHNGSKESAK
jgi:hypothetical protein